MPSKTRFTRIAPVLAFALQGCATGLPPAPPHPNGQVLWTIVNGRCVPDQRDHGNPAPCAQVWPATGSGPGYAVLKDLAGASQYLVMPTAHISGIEDPRLLAPDALDYFAAAWGVRHLVAARLNRPLARADVGIAVNSRYGRSQDLLHLHVDCLRADVRAALRAAAPGLTDRWATRPIVLDGHGYRALRVDGDETPAADPFRLLADGLHVRPRAMGAWTLVLAGETFPDGRPGFILLAARADPAHGFNGSGEDLQDHACAGLAPPPAAY